MLLAPQAPHLPHKPFSFALYFLKFYWLPLLTMILLETGQATCQILIPYAVKELIDKGSLIGTSFNGSFEQGLYALRPTLTLFVGLSLGILFFSRASGALLVILGPALRRRVRRTVFQYLQHHSQQFFLSHFSGSIANRISEVSMGVNHSLWTILFDFWPVMITFSVSFYLMTQTHTALALTLGSWVLIYILVSFLLAMRCQKYAKAFAATRSTVTGKIVDSVTNALNSKIFSRLDFEKNYLNHYLDIEVKAARKTFWFMEAMRWFQFIATMSLQIIMIILALKYWLKGGLTVGQFAMVTSLSLLIINDARGLSRRFLEFFEYLGNISDGVNLIIRNHDVVDRPTAKEIKIQNGDIEFKNVTFGYPGKEPVFKNFNVKINKGERVGLVGLSGSGKSTFTSLILRMYDVQEGQILVDNHDIRDFTQESLRSQISMIPQEPMLFHRSLLENIRYGRLEATDEEVIEAAKQARAHDFIIKQPEGYKSMVGERGVKLSGGQRQRIAIARALLKNAPLLILDEATSSLDSVTERSIQDSLNKLMVGRTVIVVAHRLSTISRLDRILVFSQGEIVEQGRHDELVQKGGHYAHLWSMQVGGFLPQHEETSPADEPAHK